MVSKIGIELLLLLLPVVVEVMELRAQPSLVSTDTGYDHGYG